MIIVSALTFRLKLDAALKRPDAKSKCLERSSLGGGALRQATFAYAHGQQLRLMLWLRS